MVIVLVLDHYFVPVKNIDEDELVWEVREFIFYCL